MKCSTHPDVETNITCSECGRPICPQCMIYTPVGAKCPDCARQRGRAVAGLRPIYYLRAGGASLTAGVVAGVILAELGGKIPFGGMLLALFAGIAIGEAVSRAARRNTDLGLQIIAGAGGALAFLLAGYFTGVPLLTVRGWQGVYFAGINPIRLLLALFGIYLSTLRLKD